MLQFAPMSPVLRIACLIVTLGCAPLIAEIKLLTNVTLIDGTGKAAQPGTYIEITDGKITAVGTGKMQPKAGTQTIDLSGKYVMPGIINLHGHLGNVIGLEQDAKNYT